MPLVSIVFGIVLIPVGWVVFEQTGREHKTALIPVILGGLLILLGALSYIEGYRKHAMHTAAMVGLLGALGSGSRVVIVLMNYFSTGEVKSMPALVGASLTTVICLVFVALCVNSFIQARRRRQAAEAQK